jgi:hypothetical protein
VCNNFTTVFSCISLEIYRISYHRINEVKTQVYCFALFFFTEENKTCSLHSSLRIAQVTVTVIRKIERSSIQFGEPSILTFSWFSSVLLGEFHD